jgi:hypothetical protein
VTRGPAAAVAVLALLLVAAVAVAQTPEAEVARALRVEWAPMSERPGIEGYVHNGSAYRVGLLQIRVMSREAAAGPATPTLAWVYGNIPAGGRTYFRVRLPPRLEVVGVEIESFRLIAREPRPESP